MFSGAFKILRFVIALLMLPYIGALAIAIYSILPSMLRTGFPYLSTEIIAIISGLALWTLLFAVVDIPDSIYIFGHELTHAIWGLCTGSTVGGIKVSSNGGSCVVSDPGMFTTLAPYFVPFYLMVILLARAVSGIWIDMRPYAAWWLAAMGFAYGFHATNTIETLTEVEQPDVLEYGRFFSYVFIIAGNLLVLGMGLSLACGTPLSHYWAVLSNGACTAYSWTWDLLVSIASSAANAIAASCKGDAV